MSHTFQSVVKATCFDATSFPSTYRLKLVDCAPRVVKLINPPKFGGGFVPVPIVKCPPAGRVPEADQLPFDPVAPATFAAGRALTAESASGSTKLSGTWLFGKVWPFAKFTTVKPSREKSPARPAAVGTIYVACQVFFAGLIWIVAVPAEHTATTLNGFALGR